MTENRTAEDEAIKYIQTINTEITETLDELKRKRKDSRELSKEDHLQLKEITDLLKKVRLNANKYIESFRVQTKLTDYNTTLISDPVKKSHELFF